MSKFVKVIIFFFYILLHKYIDAQQANNSAGCNLQEEQLYYIYNKQFSNFVMDTDSQTPPATIITYYPRSSTADEWFYIKNIPNTNFSFIINYQTNQTLAATANHVSLVTGDCLNNQQQFTFVYDAANDSCIIFSGTKVLTANSNTDITHDNLILNSAPQQWYFINVNDSTGLFTPNYPACAIPPTSTALSTTTTRLTSTSSLHTTSTTKMATTSTTTKADTTSTTTTMGTTSTTTKMDTTSSTSKMPSTATILDTSTTSTKESTSTSPKMDSTSYTTEMDTTITSTKNVSISTTMDKTSHSGKMYTSSTTANTGRPITTTRIDSTSTSTKMNTTSTAVKMDTTSTINNIYTTRTNTKMGTTSTSTNKDTATTNQMDSTISNANTKSSTSRSSTSKSSTTDTLSVCKVGDWSNFSHCSATCGDKAISHRKRMVILEGKSCPYNLSEIRSCFMMPCNPMTKTEQKIAVTIQTIGCSWIIGISAITLFLSLMFWSWNTCRVLHATEDMCFLLSHCIIAFARNNTGNNVLCTWAGIGLQYFFLAHFICHALEALHVYVIVTKAVGTESYFNLKTNLTIGLGLIGLPMMMVILTAITSYSSYVAKFSCWLNIGNNISFATILPIICCTCISAVLLESAGQYNLDNAIIFNAEHTFSAKVTQRGLLFILPLNILAWCTGMLAIYEQNIGWFTTVFALNLALGTTIGIIHISANEKASATLQIFYENDLSNIFSGKENCFAFMEKYISLTREGDCK